MIRLARPLTLGVLLEAATDPDPITGCRLWTGATDQNGYGQVWFEGRTVRLPRLLMAWSYGAELDDVPSRLSTRHTCHEPRCVEPDHLLIGLPWQNTLDAYRAGRLWWPNQFVDGRCRRGHDVTLPGAVYVRRGRRSGQRSCEQCRRERAREREVA